MFVGDGQHILLSNLAISLLDRFEQLGDLADLNKSVLIEEFLVKHTPDDHPDKLLRLSSLGMTLSVRFEHLGDLADLNRSISTQEAAVLLTLDDDPSKPGRLNNLAITLKDRFKRFDDLADLKRAVSKSEHAIRLTPKDHPDSPALFTTLATCLLRSFERLGDIDDLEMCVSLGEVAVGLTPDGHPEKPIRLTNLGSFLLTRFVQLGDLEDLHRSISTKEAAVELTANGNPDKPLHRVLANLGQSLIARFEQFGNIADLNGAVLTYEAALCHTPDGHPDKPSRLQELGISLGFRFDRLGNLADLNRSISVNETAVELTPDGHPDKPPWLASLGQSLLTRFERLGDLADINKAVPMAEAAVKLTPDNHPKKPLRLEYLANSLMIRFKHLGDLADINKAVVLSESAVNLTPDSRPAEYSSLSSLGYCLAVRFRQLGDLSDLNRSILAKEAAVRLIPDGKPNKPVELNNLGISLVERFKRLGDLADLKRAISVKVDAVQLTPDDDPHMPTRLINLANSLLTSFEVLDDIADLNKAVLSGELAVNLIPDDHPGKPMCLSNLGNFLQVRFGRQGDLSDLNRSVELKEVALHLAPDGHPEKPSLLYNLGGSLHRRFEQLHEPLDFEQMLLQFTSAACSTAGPSDTRFDACRLWAKYAHAAQHPSTFSAYTAAIDLLPELAWLGLSIRDRHHKIIAAGSLVRDAAAYAIAVNRPEKAVEWLEQGRSIIWGQLLNLRTPIDSLQEKHPALAAELALLSTQLEGASIRNNISQFIESHLQASPGSPESIAQKAHENVQKRADLLSKIRKLRGFEQFLLPKTISQLSPAAQRGPVVFLNLSTTRCDALVLLPGLGDKVKHVPLTSFTPEHAESLTQSLEGLLGYRGRSDRLDGKREGDSVNPKDRFAYILSELWVHLVKPVLDALAIKANLQRIWWCPTGPLTFLPIHAAGQYGENDTFGSKLTDFVISSYTPSLAALIEGFRPQSESQKGRQLQLLAVAQPSASGQAELPGTEEEIKCIQSHATARGTLAVHALKGDAATVNSVQKSMRDCSWVHFACHGTQDRSNPTESALLLAGSERLTLLKIIQLSLPHAQLAFLSACQTATGDKTLQEESVHLTAGMLLAGYRGVIGTMWTIMDNDAPQVADDVYKHLLKVSPPDPMTAAEALHHAVQRLREQFGGKKSFFHWVPFIHVGV
ncbi:TPR-like protein [Mycena pura]|uniref:TPR-like protein n=1 Tax=Mycena pura TaxID=153505 RepID=A0AAD6UN38_9AGAR|nr:TPR-like protein [Mycena pura]